MHRSYHPERKIENIIMYFFVIQLQNEFFQVCVHITGPCFVLNQLFIYHLKALFIFFHLNGQNLLKKINLWGRYELWNVANRLHITDLS